MSWWCGDAILLTPKAPLVLKWDEAPFSTEAPLVTGRSTKPATGRVMETPNPVREKGGVGIQPSRRQPEASPNELNR